MTPQFSYCDVGSFKDSLVLDAQSSYYYEIDDGVPVGCDQLPGKTGQTIALY